MGKDKKFILVKIIVFFNFAFTFGLEYTKLFSILHLISNVEGGGSKKFYAFVRVVPKYKCGGFFCFRFEVGKCTR